MLGVLAAATVVHWFVLPVVLAARWRVRVPQVLALGGTFWVQLATCVLPVGGAMSFGPLALFFLVPLLMIEPVVVAYFTSGALGESTRRRARLRVEEDRATAAGPPDGGVA